ncbi:hypothetical protein MMC13_004287 [Lambiella insularis]|nr:hypothetical protein [Lambiella insularis]
MPPSDEDHCPSHFQPPSASANSRSSNRVKVKPASPEVISSLISTLSAISSPAQAPFDRQPRVYLVETPPHTPRHGDNSSAEGATVASGFGMDYGAYRQPERPHDDHSVDLYDAAYPPVIRTSKPPSGLSPITAPKQFSPKYSNDSSRKDTHLLAPHGYEIPKSIGNLSIEAGAPGSSASTNSFGSGRSGPSGSQSLSLKDSKGKMRQMDRERKRTPARLRNSGSPSAHHSQVPSIGSANNESPNKHAIRAGPSPGSPQLPVRAMSMSMISILDPSTCIGDEELGSVGGGLRIPKRDSSIRHSVRNTASRHKRASHRSHGANTNEEQERLSVGGDNQVVERVSDEPEEDEVLRRIKELKIQKELRDRRKQNDEELQYRISRDTSLDQFPFPRLDQSQPSQEATANKINTLETNRSGGANEVQTPLRSSSGKGARRSVSLRRQSKRTSSDWTGKFLAQYNAQSSSTSPLYQPQEKSPTSLEISRGTYLNPIPPAGKQNDERPPTSDSIDEEVENYLSLARLSQKINHPQTGRIISFSDVGDPNGYVVICCVGMGLTRYLTAFYDELALTLKLRLITLDRPGVGESEPYTDGSDTPLGWPDDVRAVCQHLSVSRFSILAHSAGAIYALATALRMPQHIRGRLHLLAPWIPPSQLTTLGTHQEPLPMTALPYSQRLLRSLPTPFLKAANSTFLSATSASITTSLPKSPRRSKQKNVTAEAMAVFGDAAPITSVQQAGGLEGGTALDITDDEHVHGRQPDLMNTKAGTKQRQTEYDTRLTHAIWELATANANPAVDLLVCLERRQDIGFRYVDISKAVVIHHGSRDSRVPVENAKWLGKTMRRCEVRVLDGEGHGLMASAAVMGSVLTEIAKEWEDWNLVVKGKRAEKKGVAM